MTISPADNELQQSEAFSAMVRLQDEKFSERHNRLMAQISEATLEACFRQRNSEVERGIPLGHWSFESGISDAFGSMALTRKTLASMGGKNKPVDALQQVIEQLVSKNRNISKAELVAELKRLTHQGVITDVETDVDSDSKTARIWFTDGGTDKTAKIASIQHRSTRARKKHNK